MIQQIEPDRMPQTHPQSQKPTTHWPTVLQFSFSVLAIGGLLFFGLLSAAMGFLEVFSYSTSLNASLPLFLTAAGTLASAILILPSAILSLRRILGRSAATYPRGPAWFQPGLLILLFPVVVLLGYLVINQTELAWLILPFLHVLAVIIPVFWLLYMILRGLPLGSPQRSWGVFNSGLVLGPIIVMIIELIAAVVIGILGMFYISSQPGLIDEITALFQDMTTIPSDPEAMIEALAPYLTSPVVILAIFLFVSVIVPLIEEAVKPIGVWLLIGRRLSAVEGFTAGILSGAGFALFENLAMTSTGVDWALPVISRIGTAIMHIFTAGLMGWALVNARREKRYLQLGMTYLLAIFIHGFWNALSILLAVEPLYKEFGLGSVNPVISTLGQVAPFILVLLTLIAFIIMIRLNWQFRRQLIEAPQPSNPAV